MDPFCYLCFTFAFIMMSCLFLAALQSPALKRLLCVMFPCVFVTFPYGVFGQVWYLVVSIPDIYLLLYFPQTIDHDLSGEQLSRQEAVWFTIQPENPGYHLKALIFTQ